MVYRTFRWFELVGTLLGCCLLLFIIAPLVGMVLATDQEQLGSAVRDAEVVASIKLTLRAAFFATAVSAIAGVPLAYFLARKRSRNPRRPGQGWAIRYKTAQSVTAKR